MLVNKKSCQMHLFFFTGFYKVALLFISLLRDRGPGFTRGLLVMDVSVSVLRCATMSFVDGCSAVLYYTLSLPCCAVPIWTGQKAMADRGLCGLTDAWARAAELGLC